MAAFDAFSQGQPLVYCLLTDVLFKCNGFGLFSLGG